MYKAFFIHVLLLVATLALCTGSYAQAVDPISLLIAKAVKAIDLKVQGLQKETMVLQVQQQQAEHTLSQQQLKVIHHWQKALQDLYAQYFSDMQIIKRSIQQDPKVEAILELDRQMRHIYERIPPAQLAQVDQWLPKRSLLLQQLSAVLEPGVSMTDAERLFQIDTIHSAMQNLSDAWLTFNEKLIRQKGVAAQKKMDTQYFKKKYGI